MFLFWFKFKLDPLTTELQIKNIFLYQINFDEQNIFFIRLNRITAIAIAIRIAI